MHIDEVVKCHQNNLDVDIIFPTLKTKSKNNTNIVRAVTNSKKDILYLSRANVPFEFKKDNKNYLKHLSIISFKPEALRKYSYKKTNLEKIEDIELLRALEIGLKIRNKDIEW